MENKETKSELPTMKGLKPNEKFNNNGIDNANPSFPHFEGLKENDSSTDIESLPSFYQLVKNRLPKFLKDVALHANSDQEADALILSSITIASSCFANVWGLYDCKVVFPNLYFFLMGKASSGKGCMVDCFKLIQKIQDDKTKETNLAIEKYKRDMRILKANPETAQPPVEPCIKSLIIPANSSKAIIYRLLEANDGVGLIGASESDSASSNFSLDYGNYSSILREAYHNEPISIARVKDMLFIHIECPRLSVALSGTPDQLLSLIPNAENGLFSRFMLYVKDLELNWHNVFRGNISLGEYFSTLGNEFYDLYTTLQTIDKIEFRLTQEQMDYFNSFFEGCQEECYFIYGDDIIASVRRIGLMAFRIAMIFTILRIIETGDISTVQICSDDDFHSAISIAKVLLAHSARVYSFLPVRHVINISNVDIKDKQQYFFDNLPDTFGRKEFISVSKKIGIPLSTAERIIKYFCDNGYIHRCKRGLYKKTSDD